VRAQSASGMRKLSVGMTEESLRWKDERPDLAQVGVGELEGVQHGLDLRCRLLDRVGREACLGLGDPGPLPEGSLGLDICEQRTGDDGEDRVQVGAGGLRNGSMAGVHLDDGVTGYCGLRDRPKKRVVLPERGIPLSDCAKPFRHAERERQVDGQGKARAGAVQGPGDGVEDCGVDQALAGAEIVARRYQVCTGEDRVDERADAFGLHTLGLRTEDEAGLGPMATGQIREVEVVACRQDPGKSGGDGGHIRDQSDIAVHVFAGT